MTSDDRRCDSVFGLAVKTPKMVYDALRKFRPSEVSADTSLDAGDYIDNVRENLEKAEDDIVYGEWDRKECPICDFKVDERKHKKDLGFRKHLEHHGFREVDCQRYTLVSNRAPLHGLKP
jgi:hypothetical protein